MAVMVTKEFNRICTQAGVQCTVTMDPQDWKKVYQFENLGKHRVELSHNKTAYVLRPGEKMSFKSMHGEEPTVTKWFVWYEKAT